jgi:hypothetical protein
MPAKDAYINANELTPKQLADLLKSIGQDEKKYQQYLSFKQHPISPHFQEIVDMSYVHPNVVVRLCDYAQQRNNQTIVAN